MVDVEKKDLYYAKISTGEKVVFKQPISYKEAMNFSMGLMFNSNARGVIVFDSNNFVQGIFLNERRFFSEMDH
jgi:hypothetical protein